MLAAVLVMGCVANPMVTQQTIHTTICVSGWTDTVRPSTVYTNGLKTKQLRARLHDPVLRKYEEDHVCPLELGGHPSDSRNLRPQKWTGPRNAHLKDRLENKLHDLVCAGSIDLNTARSEISRNWYASYRKRIK